MFFVDLLLVALTVFSSWSFGRLLLRFTGLTTKHRSVRFALAVGLGFGVLIYAGVVFGFAGVLEPTSVWTLMGVTSFIGMAGAVRWRPSPFVLRWQSTYLLHRWPYVCVLATIGAYSVGYMFVALAPTLEGDSIAGYLVTARDYARAGNFVSVEYAYTNIFPANGQILSTFGYLLRGQILAQLLVAWSMGLLAAVTIYAIGRTWLNRRSAVLGVGIWYAMTAVAVLAASAKIDLAWAAFDLLVLLSFGHWYFAGKGQRDWRWLALAGVFLGLAGGVKQASVFTAAAMAVGISYRLLADRDSDLKQWTLSFVPLVVLALPAVIWVVRALALTDTPGFTGANLKNDSGAGGFFKAIWDMSMLGNTATTEGTNGKSIGPTMLAVIPLLAVTRRVDGRVWHMLAFALVMVLVWFFAVQRARHLLPTLGVLALISGYVVAMLMERRPLVGRTLIVVTLAVVTVSFASWGWINFVSLDTVARAVNINDNNEYFERNLPKFDRYPNAAVTKFFREDTLNHAVVGSPSHSNGLYIDRPLHDDWTQTEVEVGDPESFATMLRDAGITHVYVNDFLVQEEGQEEAWLARRDFQNQFLNRLFCHEGQCIYKVR